MTQQYFTETLVLASKHLSNVNVEHTDDQGSWLIFGETPKTGLGGESLHALVNTHSAKHLYLQGGEWRFIGKD